MLETVRRLVDHLRWADERVLAALGASAVPAEALRIYAHLVAAEHVWLSRLRGETPALPVLPRLSLEDCARIGAENATGLTALVNEMDEHDLPREVSYRTSAGESFASTVEDILVHLAMHGSYHRGQIAMLLRQGGAEPAATDYVVFLRGASRVGPPPSRGGERTRRLGYDE